MHNISENEIPHFTFHDLRRTCETGMAMLGTPQSIIDRIMNHVSGRGMARVCNMYEYQKEKTEALQKWDKHIRGLISRLVFYGGEGKQSLLIMKVILTPMLQKNSND